MGTVNGLFKVLVTDNTAYFTSSELKEWFVERFVEHKSTLRIGARVWN